MEEEQVKKKGFWKKLQESKWKQVCFFVGCMGVMLGIYLPISNYIKAVREKNAINSESIVMDTDLLTHIELEERNDGKKVFAGWVLRMNSKISNVQIILRATDESEVMILNAVGRKNESVKNYFAANWETGDCGYTSSYYSKQIDDEICYEVLLRITYIENSADSDDRKEVKINAHRYLYDDKLYSYDPTSFAHPEFKEHEMQQVIEEGVLHIYDAALGLYVYQHDKKIYWITTRMFPFDEQDNARIPFNVRTFQYEKLPEHQKEYKFDSLDFWFKDKEIPIGTGQYRVAVYELPSEYVTTYIATGDYDYGGTGWIKRYSFQIDHFFNEKN